MTPTQTDSAARGLAAWHEVVRARDPARIGPVIADTCVFRSPILHRPQEGRDLTIMYLTGALYVLGNDSFTYVREVASGDDAVLEFRTTVEGIDVNGVDMLHFDADGRIDDFTVMLRPRKAIDLVQARMAALLEAR